MTHDELLEKIRLKFFVNEEGATGSGYKESQLRNAVYAVVELHNCSNKYCSNCGMASPCFTIEAIKKELE